VNVFERQIELYLEEVIEVLGAQLHAARETLRRHREHHHHHPHKHLGAIAIAFQMPPPEGVNMATAGPLKLTTVGQQATATILYFDTDGNPMPSDFTPPAVAFSTDDTSGAVAKVVDNGDNTATVTDVANGTSTLSASATSAEGLAVSDSQSITVDNGTPPPPTSKLGSIKIAF